MQPSDTGTGITPTTEKLSEGTGLGFRVYRLKGHRGLREMFRPHQRFPRTNLEDIVPLTERREELITPATRIGSIGSCFAWEIKKWLVANGYTFLQVEDGPSAESGSARFGNVFNTRCMRQIFERAYGHFEPVEPFWPYRGKLMDPFRKNVGWDSEDEARAELASHAAAVRRLVQQAEVLVCTIGQAEVWRRRDTKEAFFMIPPPEVIDERIHETALTTVDENVENLCAMYELLRRHNPRLRLIVTVSPVPLLATFRDEHAVVADELSKSILRVAAHRFCETCEGVDYFPAYEIVKRLSGSPWKDDNRHVRDEVVARVMRIFMHRYGRCPTDPPLPRAASA